MLCSKQKPEIVFLHSQHAMEKSEKESARAPIKGNVIGFEWIAQDIHVHSNEE
jgi:hypothetical protein